jgi:hypothetical protein
MIELFIDVFISFEQSIFDKRIDVCKEDNGDDDDVD